MRLTGMGNTHHHMTLEPRRGVPTSRWNKGKDALHTARQHTRVLPTACVAHGVARKLSRLPALFPLGKQFGSLHLRQGISFPAPLAACVCVRTAPSPAPAAARFWASLPSCSHDRIPHPPAAAAIASVCVLQSVSDSSGDHWCRGSLSLRIMAVMASIAYSPSFLSLPSGSNGTVSTLVQFVARYRVFLLLRSLRRRSQRVLCSSLILICLQVSHCDTLQPWRYPRSWPSHAQIQQLPAARASLFAYRTMQLDPRRRELAIQRVLRASAYCFDVL